MVCGIIDEIIKTHSSFSFARLSRYQKREDHYLRLLDAYISCSIDLNLHAVMAEKAAMGAWNGRKEWQASIPLQQPTDFSIFSCLGEKIPFFSLRFSVSKPSQIYNLEWPLNQKQECWCHPSASPFGFLNNASICSQNMLVAFGILYWSAPFLSAQREETVDLSSCMWTLSKTSKKFKTSKEIWDLKCSLCKLHRMVTG